MTLIDMKDKKNYEIQNITTKDDVLRERLVALGICQGAKANLLECSIAKATIAILSNNTRVALRVTEAQEVTIKEIT